MKYKVGQTFYMKRTGQGLVADEAIIIIRVYKRKHRTYVDAQNIGGNVFLRISAKRLRKRPRHI